MFSLRLLQKIEIPNKLINLDLINYKLKNKPILLIYLAISSNEAGPK